MANKNTPKRRELIAEIISKRTPKFTALAPKPSKKNLNKLLTKA